MTSALAEARFLAGAERSLLEFRSFDARCVIPSATPIRVAGANSLFHSRGKEVLGEGRPDHHLLRSMARRGGTPLARC